MKNFFKKCVRGLDRIISLIEWRVRRIFKRVKKDKSARSLLKDILLILVIIIILAVSAFLFWAASLKTPDLSSFDDRLLGQSAKIYDRTGNVLLYDLGQNVRRTVVPFDQISPYLKEATISIEDTDFYSHGGIKPTSIIRAAFADLFSAKYSQGGSTITQQVVKNSLLTDDKSISRKLKEWILAIKLEQTTDKNTILDLYLNDTPYGGNIYGVEEASQTFFGKKSSDLTIAEAAYIAALPQAPSLYSPYGDNKNLLIDRKNLVLKKMYENNYITQDQYAAALKENVVFQPKSLEGIKAPHFVMYIRDYLEQKYGDKMLETGGFKVITTLDWDMQQEMEQVVKNYVLTSGVKYQASNGAMVAADPRTGQILAMVGSRDYFDTQIDGNFNVATARRQPGSSFKPFVYGTAFNEGFTPDTPIYDVATQFNASCGVDNKPLPSSPDAKCYNPVNYEGGYEGLMTIRSALAQSRNVPAVKMLHLVGIDNALKTATDMGITGLGTADQYGLSLALGAAQVSPLDMAEAYGVFANEGLKATPTGILSIQTNDGVTLESFSTSTEQVIPQQTADLMNDVLSDPYARSSIFGPSYFGTRQVAIKTGTTNDSRDAWEIGYTPSISVSAWMGNNDDTPMAQQASARIIGPMWKQFMDWELARLPDETFEAPEPIATSTKPFMRGVWQGPGNEVHSELFWIDRNDPAGPAPEYSSTDPLFKNWEYAVQNWASKNSISVANMPQPVETTTTSTTPTSGTGFTIVTPQDKAAIPKNTSVSVTVAGATSDTSEVDYYINDLLIGKSTKYPFPITFVPAQITGIQDEDELKAVDISVLGKYQETTTLFSVI